MTEPASVVIGHIRTMSDDAPEAEAMVIRGTTIEFVGSRVDAIAAAGPDATVDELPPGQTVVPGFLDGHGHLAMVTLFNSLVDLTPKPIGTIGGIDDLVATLRRALDSAGGTPDGGWVMGCNYDDSLMAERSHPTRHDLDAVTTKFPVVVIHASAHLAVANSKALEVCGITDDSADPPGGVLRRDAEGHLTGVLEEHAWMDLVMPHIPRPAPEEAVRDLMSAQMKYAAQGFTTVQEGFTDPPMLALLRGADAAGAVFLDVVSYPAWLGAKEMLADATPDDGYRGRVRMGGVKMVLDGSPQGKTAWLTEPYLMPPEGMSKDYCGYPAMPDEAAQQAVAEHHAAGWQVLAHCNGDAACQQFIDAAVAARGSSQSGDSRDFVMIHAQTVRDDQLDRMAEVGVMPSFFITHVYYWGDWHRDQVLGPKRAERISPLASAAARGLRFSLHNDPPIAPIRSMQLVSSAVNRVTLSGAILGPEQRVPIDRAMRAMTIDAAYQYGEEASKGSLDAGKQADFVVLSADPYEVAPEELAEVAIVRTVSRGRTVHGG